MEVRNRFKGLDLIDRVPEELWMEFCDIVLEAGKRNAKRQNDCLKRAYKQLRKGEAKGNREKERYTHLNAEFQRIVRRNKKAFLSDQCKEVEENNRMEKIRDLFKNIRNNKGTFQAKMNTIKQKTIWT